MAAIRSASLPLLIAVTRAFSRVGAQAARDGGMATSMRSWAYGQMKKGRQPVYLYMYSHGHSYAPGVVIADINPQSAGAYHSSEIPFFLLTLDAYNRIRPTRAWNDGDRALAATMSEILIAFASSGSPQTQKLRLPRFDARREPLIEFGDEVKPISFNVLPAITRAAIIARDTPMHLETNGTVREARGLTSMT